MICKQLALLSLLILGGCAPAGILATEPVHTVTIDGTTHQVQKMPGNENGWAAQNADLARIWLDPSDYLRNVKAIEAYTGCHVIRETVRNQGANTTAMVDCYQK